MKIKVYVVSKRRGCELLDPFVSTDEPDAYDEAAGFLYEAALYAWESRYISDELDTEEEPPDYENMQEWAEEQGYVFSDSFFWDGSGDGYEVYVTKHTIEI